MVGTLAPWQLPTSELHTRPMRHAHEFKMLRRLIWVTSLLFLGNSYAVPQQLPDSLKDGLLKGYMSTCVPTIQSQLAGVVSDQTKIIAYCACVGGKTFRNMTQRQYDYLMAKSKLPPEIESMRGSWRSQCNSLLN